MFFAYFLIDRRTTPASANFAAAACNFKVFPFCLCGAKRPKKNMRDIKRNMLKLPKQQLRHREREANNNKNIKLRNTFIASEKGQRGRGAEKEIFKPEKRRMKNKKSLSFCCCSLSLLLSGAWLRLYGWCVYFWQNKKKTRRVSEPNSEEPQHVFQLFFSVFTSSVFLFFTSSPSSSSSSSSYTLLLLLPVVVVSSFLFILFSSSSSPFSLSPSSDRFVCFFFYSYSFFFRGSCCCSTRSLIRVYFRVLGNKKKNT